MNRNKKISSILLAALYVFIILLSAFYMASEAEHDCQGDNCTVCCNIAVCKNALSSELTVPGVGILIFFTVIFAAMNAKELICFSYTDTLVTLKVKLSD